ncbi:ATP-dependent DNA helicase RecG [Patescibacteria group bacterium]
MITLSTKIEQLKRVGPEYLRKLRKVGIKTIGDLLYYFPYRYDDYSQIIPIENLQIGEVSTIQGKVLEINNIRTWKRKMNITEAIVQDDSGAIRAVWFNQPYLAQTIKQDCVINLSGKISLSKKNICFSNPTYEIIHNDDFTHTGRLIPIYHETQGLSSRYLRYLIKPYLYLTNEINDFLPLQIRNEFNLIDLNTAINQIHFPNNLNTAKSAKERLAFDELLLIQLTILKQKQNLSKQKAIPISFNKELIKKFVKNLPFKLTNDQRISAWEIFQDISKNEPMNRLLNGDVGSGKTIIAIMTALETAKAGYQTAIMAPTEILAKQHFNTFTKTLKNTKVKTCLLTGSSSNKEKIKQEISDGKIDIIIGTHAIIQKNLDFKNLAISIVDEQHRFGVRQRAALQNSLKAIPHLLSMTATPIPRTLTLTIYGDLNISMLKQMPKGRQKIITKIITPNNRQNAYNFIKEQIKQKKQVFVVCPLIEESENEIMAEVKSVTQEYKKLSEKIFPKFKISMLHGRLKPKEKEKIMKDFENKKIDMLVSTSVIEVGIDIPNATVMMIEGADRFGLAQIHQIRGRIGRGENKSYCFLFTESTSKKTRQRLKAILTCKNGFELAEKDLEIRGPGDFLGSRQWGIPDLTMASLNDLELIKQSRQAALKIISNNLFNNDLKNEVKKFKHSTHLE